MIGGHPKIAVRIPNWIGDVVMSLPAQRAIRRTYPDAEIAVIARPFLRDLAMFQPGIIDRVIDFRDRDADFGWREFVSFCRRLRAQRFDHSFVFTHHLKGALMMKLAGVPQRVGFSVIKRAIRFRPKRVRRKTSDRHESATYLELLRSSGISLPDEDQAPRLDRRHDAEDEVTETLLSSTPKPYLVIHAGAAYGTAKRWRHDRFAQVGRKFIEEYGGSVILLGVASEAEVNREIDQLVGSPGVVNLCGNTSLNQSLCVIAQSDVFLSNDSGLMHVAAAFSRPQVAIFGPTDVSTTFPHNPRAVVMYKNVSCSPCFKRHCPIDHRCMTRISADEVWQAMEGLMNQTPQP